MPFPFYTHTCSPNANLNEHIFPHQFGQRSPKDIVTSLQRTPALCDVIRWLEFYECKCGVCTFSREIHYQIIAKNLRNLQVGAYKKNTTRMTSKLYAKPLLNFIVGVNRFETFRVSP